MSPKDHNQLCQWLRAKATYNEVMSADPIGLVGNVRFSETARQRWLFLWNWSAPRFSGSIGIKQDRCYSIMGKDFLNRRFRRINRIVQCLTGQ